MTVESVGAAGQGPRQEFDNSISFEDARNLRIEFDRDINTRIDAVQDATALVARHEADLQRNLEQGVHLATGLDADAFRAQARTHPDYAALREAAGALTSYLAEQMPLVEAAIEPSRMFGREGLLVGQAADALDQALDVGAATPAMFSDLSTLAGHASTGIDAGPRVLDGALDTRIHGLLSATGTALDIASGTATPVDGSAVPDTRTANAGTLAGHAAASIDAGLHVLEGALDTRIGGVLSATGTALGIVSATATLAEGASALDSGTADAGTHLQMAGAVGTFASAGLAVLGAARAATPVGLGATAVGYTGQFVSSVAENGRVFEGTVDSLVASGLTPEVAQVVASAPAGTLQLLQGTGNLDAARIQTLATQAPAALRAPPEAIQALLDTVPLRGEALASFLASTAPDTGLVIRGAVEVGLRGLPATPDSLASHLTETRPQLATRLADALRLAGAADR